MQANKVITAGSVLRQMPTPEQVAGLLEEFPL